MKSYILASNKVTVLWNEMHSYRFYIALSNILSNFQGNTKLYVSVHNSVLNKSTIQCKVYEVIYFNASTYFSPLVEALYIVLWKCVNGCS
jgi:hypothetical protein